MEIEFVGAARTVTGSKHIVRTSRSTILLDCGMYQGRRRESFERNRHLGFEVEDITAVVLSHAHIDHSGSLPMLARYGYRGNVYATPATRDLCAAMLADAAMIQQQDARYIERAISREEGELEPVEPLYTQDDVTEILSAMISVPYHRMVPIAEDVRLTFLDAGHVLGSAIVVLDVDDEGERKRLVFTGDLGRRRIPILRDPELPTGAHALITESTYGDRLHRPIEEMDDQLAAALKRVYERGGKVIIPSFALERAQEVIFALRTLQREGRLPRMPVYVDSPLTVKITDVFRLHPDCYDKETRELLRSGQNPFELDLLRYVTEKEDSQAIDQSKEPCVIISASGMCEAGRVLHHLKACVEDPKNMVMIVGFQAQHTLGRRIVEKRPKVRIFGVERELRAEVLVLNGFSAHADQNDLLDFAEGCRKTGPLRNVFLVHGETKPQETLQEMLGDRGFPSVHIPAPGARLRV